MDILDIEGRTRVFGAPKDWNPERDGPCGALPVRDEARGHGVNMMVSEWKPSEIELEHLKLGAPLQLGVVGTVHPVVSLGVGSPPPRDREEPAARLSKIQALMNALEDGPSITLQHETDEKAFEANEVVFGQARALILALLGISAKPRGEQIADALAARAKAAAQEIAGDDAAGTLPDMLRFTKRWLPECFPAEDNGQIPFARALCESLVECAEEHLKREAAEREDARLDRLATKARRDALSDE